VRNPDQLLRNREAEFLERFRRNLKQSQLGDHLRTRPLEYEWIDAENLVVALCDVESVNEFELRALHDAIGVESRCTITPMHLNRLRISFQCRMSGKPDQD